MRLKTFILPLFLFCACALSCSKVEDIKTQDIPLFPLEVMLSEEEWAQYPTDKCFLAIGCDESDSAFWERPMSLSAEFLGDTAFLFYDPYPWRTKQVLYNYMDDFSLYETRGGDPCEMHITLRLSPEKIGVCDFRVVLDLIDTGERIYSQKYRIEFTGSLDDLGYKISDL